MSAHHEARPLLLLVDDDPAIAETLAWVLEADFQVLPTASRAAALETLRNTSRPLDTALIDLGLPPHPHRPDEGLALVSDLLAADPGLKIVVLSGQDAVASARHARAMGAFEFHAKPAAPAVLREALLRAAKLTAEDRALAHQTRIGLIGDSPAMQALREQISRLAGAPFPVLIEGESGTGKELVAQALHQGSPRQAKPLVAVNCAAIAPPLIEAALFGHARGAFTGAATSRPGFFEEAADGTLFLDEIGELPRELQPKLLRVLENGEYQRIGETQARTSTARILAATNRNLRDEVRAGRFRADLYHRLGVLSIVLPPLRQLGDDRFLLLAHYLRQFQRQNALAAFTLDPAAHALWAHYAFPGNVRELRNIVLRLLARHAGKTIGHDALEAEMDVAVEAIEPHGGDPLLEALRNGAGFSLDDVLRRTERRYVEAALREAQGSVTQAARLLGMNRTTLYSRMTTLGIHPSGAED